MTWITLDNGWQLNIDQVVLIKPLPPPGMAALVYLSGSVSGSEGLRITITEADLERLLVARDGVRAHLGGAPTTQGPAVYQPLSIPNSSVNITKTEPVPRPRPRRRSIGTRQEEKE